MYIYIYRGPGLTSNVILPLSVSVKMKKGSVKAEKKGSVMVVLLVLASWHRRVELTGPQSGSVMVLPEWVGVWVVAWVGSRSQVSSSEFAGLRVALSCWLGVRTAWLRVRPAEVFSGFLPASPVSMQGGPDLGLAGSSASCSVLLGSGSVLAGIAGMGWLGIRGCWVYWFVAVRLLGSCRTAGVWVRITGFRGSGSYNPFLTLCLLCSSVRDIGKGRRMNQEREEEEELGHGSH
jgi:hypothetical protein